MITHCENCNSELTRGDHFRHEQNCKKYKITHDESSHLCKACEDACNSRHALAAEYDEDQPHIEY